MLSTVEPQFSSQLCTMGAAYNEKKKIPKILRCQHVLVASKIFNIAVNDFVA